MGTVNHKIITQTCNHNLTLYRQLDHWIYLYTQETDATGYVLIVAGEISVAFDAQRLSIVTAAAWGQCVASAPVQWRIARRLSQLAA